MDEAFVKDGFFDVIGHYPQLLWEGMEVWDWGFLIGLTLWLTLLLIPLKDYDRRDIIAGLLYGLFGMMAGMCFFFIIPEQDSNKRNYFLYTFAMLAFALVYLARWFWNYRPLIPRSPPTEPEDSVSPKMQQESK